MLLRGGEGQRVQRTKARGQSEIGPATLSNVAAFHAMSTELVVRENALRISYGTDFCGMSNKVLGMRSG